MLLSPQDWRKTFKPRLKRLYSYVKGKAPEAKIFFHSCGAIRPIIKDLIEVGVDILNPIQPLAEGMNPESLKEEFGEKICFHGGIDVQQVMSSIGAFKDVEREVKGKIKALAPGGGYILASSHNLQPDSSPEKIVAMYDYALKYGKYPIKIN
jgi:uroporphyrinogen decarboxylase